MGLMKRPSPGSLREMAAAIRSTDIAARQWLDEGFSPGDAQAYIAAGCFDVPRTAELRQAGISPLDMVRSGLGWEYSSGSLSMLELRLVLGGQARGMSEKKNILC